MTTTRRRRLRGEEPKELTPITVTYTRHKDLPETLPDGQKSLTAAGWGEEPPARSKW